MIPKEALNWCEQFIDNLVSANVDTKKRTLGLQAMQTCKSALEKQIQKKPIWDMGWVCPNCKHAEILNFPKRPEWDDLFCKKCGQALDWGDCE